MRIKMKGVIIITFALFFTITGLVFHCLAIFSKRWIVAIPRQARGPNDHIHYYSLWTRCQYSNTSFVIPDISSQPNIENFVCRPNTYLHYDIFNKEITDICYESRHQCSSIIGVHPYCKCQYLFITQIQQWCSIFVSIFLFLAILILYLKLIAKPQNRSATILLKFVPMILLSLALILMILIMILVGIYLRRNEYEDYDIKLPKIIQNSLPDPPETFNLYRINSYFKNYKNTNQYRQTLSIFKSIHEERFYARIDWSAGAEIIAIILTFIADMLCIILALAQVN